jgi:hypothetical protein
MTRYPSLLRNVVPLACTLLMLLMEAWLFLSLCLRPSPVLVAAWTMPTGWKRRQLNDGHERCGTPQISVERRTSWLTVGSRKRNSWSIN